MASAYGTCAVAHCCYRSAHLSIVCPITHVPWHSLPTENTSLQDIVTTRLDCGTLTPGCSCARLKAIARTSHRWHSRPTDNSYFPRGAEGRRTLTLASSSGTCARAQLFINSRSS